MKPVVTTDQITWCFGWEGTPHSHDFAGMAPITRCSSPVETASERVTAGCAAYCFSDSDAHLVHLCCRLIAQRPRNQDHVLKSVKQCLDQSFGSWMTVTFKATKTTPAWSRSTRFDLGLARGSKAVFRLPLDLCFLAYAFVGTLP